MRTTALLLSAALVALQGCSACDTVPSYALESCQASQVLPDKVQTDILFVVDDSGSMSDNQANLANSLGVFIAALAASRHPSVERLVLLAPAFRLHERWRSRVGPADLARWQGEGSVEVHHHATDRPRRIGWAFFEDAAQWPPFPVVHVPALCIAGGRDDTVPLEDVRAWVDRTPGARLEVVDDGHELLGSLPRIVELTRAFLADAPSGYAR